MCHILQLVEQTQESRAQASTQPPMSHAVPDFKALHRVKCAFFFGNPTVMVFRRNMCFAPGGKNERTKGKNTKTVFRKWYLVMKFKKKNNNVPSLTLSAVIV